jgi:Na+/H+-dicarboxylate symporter
MDGNRFFGGNPVAVIVRLVILSIVVGIVLSALNIRPTEIIYHIRRLFQRLYDLGFASIESVLEFFLIGAVIVIPIWVIARLFGLMRKGDDGRR